MKLNTLQEKILGGPAHQIMTHRRTLVALILSAVLIIAAETLIMFVLEFDHTLQEHAVVVLDGVLLSLFLLLVLFPLNYYFVVRPMAQQIEARQQANEELRKSLEVQEGLFTVKDLGIAYLDTQFHFVRVNHTFANLLRLQPEDMQGRHHSELFPDPAVLPELQKVLTSGTTLNRYEQPYTEPDGVTRYWDVNVFPVRGQDLNPVALLIVIHDMTAQREARLKQQEMERRFQAMFNQAFAQVMLLDPDGRVLQASQSVRVFTGCSPEEYQGQILWQLPWWHTSGDNRERLQAAVRRASSGLVAQGVFRLRSARQTGIVHVNTVIKPLLDEQGRVQQLIYEANDISEQTRMVETLRLSEEKMKSLYQAEKSAREIAETMRSAGIALSSSLDTHTVLNALLDHLAQVIPYTSAHVLLFENEHSLVVELQRGEEDWLPEERLLGRHLEVSDLPFLQPMLNERRTLVIPDTQAAPNLQVWSSPQRARSWMGFPLLAGEQVIGVCSMKHPAPNFFTSDHLHLAHTLTSQAAVAIQNAWLFGQVVEGRQRLQALSRRLVEVQENERQYIARELHDEAGQGLASLMVGLRLVERDCSSPDSVVARAGELKQIADGVLENLRRLAIDLRPAALDHMGLVSALRQHAERVSDQQDLTVEFSTLGKIERLPSEVETTVYRIVQEALTNIVRHSHANRAEVLLDRRADSLIVVVEDNGIGFDPERSNEGRLGLIGIRERAEMLGGKLTLETGTNHGTTLILEIPCPSES